MEKKSWDGNEVYDRFYSTKMHTSPHTLPQTIAFNISLVFNRKKNLFFHLFAGGHIIERMAWDPYTLLAPHKQNKYDFYYVA